MCTARPSLAPHFRTLCLGSPLQAARHSRTSLGTLEARGAGRSTPPRRQRTGPSAAAVEPLPSPRQPLLPAAARAEQGKGTPKTTNPAGSAPAWRRPLRAPAPLPRPLLLQAACSPSQRALPPARQQQRACLGQLSPAVAAGVESPLGNRPFTLYPPLAETSQGCLKSFAIKSDASGSISGLDS